MKRSEAVQLIKEKAEHQISEQVAESILSGLEEAGMLPPGKWSSVLRGDTAKNEIERLKWREE